MQRLLEHNPFNPEDAALAQQAAEHEARIMEGEVQDTWRGLDDLNKKLGPFYLDIRELIEGKAVGDVGSGLGGLAKSVAAEHINATIWSINPHLVDPKYKYDEEQATAAMLWNRYHTLDQSEVARIQQLHDSHLSTAFAHGLNFHDETFDMLIDSSAVSANLTEGQELLYEQSIREMMRVLKPGGMIVIIDNMPSAVGDSDPFTGEVRFKEKTLQKLDIPYSPIYDKRRSGAAVGAILYKV
jgi:SAM-dependent methyltransferase